MNANATSEQSNEQRLRALRDKYRRQAAESRLAACEQRFLRKEAERRNLDISKTAQARIDALQAEIQELNALTAFSRRQLRRTRLALQAAAATLLVSCGVYFGTTSGPEPERRSKPIVAEPRQEFIVDRPVLKPMAAAEQPKPLPRLGCQNCAAAADMSAAKTESHVLASVKMSNGSTGCSATVVGDPLHFREHRKVLVVSAAHCVSGNIGKSATFYNPDGATSFPATLLAFNREFDCALFVADSDKPLGAVLMADPGDWDQRARFSSCNYPAQSGGPNYKFCRYAGSSTREGANSGHLFAIDQVSQEHDGVFSSGGSGGGLFVQPYGSTDWFYFGATTHGGDGTAIATTQHSDLYGFIAANYPPADDNDCGLWCRRPPRRPKLPIDPNTPPGDGIKPPWYNPNLPIDPGNNPAPPPPPPNEKPPVAPGPPDATVDELKGRVERLEQKLELTIKQVTDIKISPPTVGPVGPPGKVGTNGKDGTVPEVDYARLELKAEATARAAVDALVASGALTGKPGEPGPAGVSISIEEIVKQVNANLPPIEMVFDENDASANKKVRLGERVMIPPVRMELRKDGRSYPNAKPLGKPLVLEFAPQ